MTAALLALYRIRSIPLVLAIVTLLAIAFSGWIDLPPVVDAVKSVVGLVALVVGLTAAGLTVLGPRLLPQHEPRVVASPVSGRWLAMNSPATKVPSHGIRAYGQAYAIDLVAEPHDAERPIFGSGGAWRRSSEYPAFGQPVHAMIDGVVVAVSDGRRDHHARSTMLSVLYLSFLEAPVREIGGPGFIIGNHVVIRGDDGVFALVAHLQRGSARVTVGERVAAGQQIALCGNSGNSSEPHVHAQLMDRARPLVAQGLPMVFPGVRIDDADASDGMPADGQHLTA